MLEGVISSQYDRFTTFTLKEETVYEIKSDLNIEKTKVAFKENPRSDYGMYGYDYYKRMSYGYSDINKTHKSEALIAKDEDDFDWEAEDLVLWDTLSEEEKLQVYVRYLTEREGCEMCGKPMRKWAWYDSVEELVLCDYHHNMSLNAVKVSFKGAPNITYKEATSTPLDVMEYVEDEMIGGLG